MKINFTQRNIILVTVFSLLLVVILILVYCRQKMKKEARDYVKFSDIFRQARRMSSDVYENTFLGRLFPCLKCLKRRRVRFAQKISILQSQEDISTSTSKLACSYTSNQLTTYGDSSKSLSAYGD